MVHRRPWILAPEFSEFVLFVPCGKRVTNDIKRIKTRKTDHESIVNIPEMGYSEMQEETATVTPNKDFKGLELTDHSGIYTGDKSVGDYTERLMETEKLLHLMTTLKSILKDFDKVYETVQNNEIYSDVTREEIMEYYQKYP